MRDPNTGQWILTGDMTSGRSEPSTRAFFCGMVPFSCQSCQEVTLQTPISNANLYDPRSGSWVQAGTMSSPRPVMRLLSYVVIEVWW